MAARPDIDTRTVAQLRKYAIRVAEPFIGHIDVDDVFSVALEVLARHLHKYGGFVEERFWNDVYRDIIDQLRSEYGRRGAARYEARLRQETLDGTDVRCDDDPLDAVLEAELTREVLAVCNDRERFIVLARLDGDTNKTIARRLGVTEQRVWQMLRAVRGRVA